MHSGNRRYGPCVAALAAAIMLAAGTFACKQAADAPDAAPPMAMKSEMAKEMRADTDTLAGAAEQEESLDRVKRGGPALTGHFLSPMDLAAGRLLEYRVVLIYESDDLAISRRELLGVAARHGFVKQSDSSMEGKSSSVASELMVKSEKLYDALRDIDRVGTLKSETISVTDHTEGMVLQERASRREQIRIARRNAASAGVAPGAKNWAAIEESLAQSEDRLDSSDQEKWRIRDRVAWASVRVEIRGPDLPGQIEVPRYVDALVDLANGMLALLYGLIYLIPFAVVAAVVIWHRRRIAALFRGKKE